MASNRTTTRQVINNPIISAKKQQRQCAIITNTKGGLDVANKINDESRPLKAVTKKRSSSLAPIKEIKVENRTMAKSSDRSVSGSISSAKSNKKSIMSITTTHTVLARRLTKTPIESSASRKIARSKTEDPPSVESHDIVWKGFKSKELDDSSVAGSLQGSWVSKKSVQTADGKRRNSTSVTAGSRSVSYRERPDCGQFESKRRHSTSALNSLVQGDIQLSPFVKNELRSKHSRSLTLSDNDQASCHDSKFVGKKVRFAKSETACFFPSRMKITPENAKLLWWTGEERQAMKRRAQRIGLRFLSITAKYHLAVEQLLSKCKNDKYTEGRTYFAEKEAIRILINHDARGLELAMISALNLESCRHYNRSVKQSVICVLNTQAMWKRSNLKSSDEQWQMIATEQQQHSVVATRFARILAEGDARYVRGHYGSDEDSESSLVPGLTEESSMSTSSSEEYDNLEGSFTI